MTFVSAPLHKYPEMVSSVSRCLQVSVQDDEDEDDDGSDGAVGGAPPVRRLWRKLDGKVQAGLFHCNIC